MHASRWAPHNQNEDTFAQTREPDNLFDDDIVPVSEPIVKQLPSVEQSTRAYPPNQHRGRGNGRARGRGRGGRTTESPRRQDSTTPQSNEPKQSTPSSTPASENANAQPIASTPTEQTGEPSTQDISVNDAAATEATTASEVPKVQAVRGPRHQTGGIQRPKLTEDELSARMAAAALNNAKREAAHKEAEADAAKFEAREAAARQRRTQETAARRVMDNERERNRQRKLGAQGIREWDQGKEDSQLAGGQQKRDQRPGPLANADSRDYVDDESYSAGGEDGGRGNFRGRGRGRGRGQRGRGRGRGGYDGNTGGTQTDGSVPPLGEEHFPTLNTAPKDSSLATSKQPSAVPMSPIADKGTWADQVEASQQ